MTTPNEPSLVITAKLAQEILNYIVKQPFAEVFQLVQQLQALPKLEPSNAPENQQDLKET